MELVVTVRQSRRDSLLLVHVYPNKYMDKRVSVQLNAARKVSVLDEAVEETNPAEKSPIGMVVLRGSSVVVVDALDKIS
ncbi:hypothetical protein BGZ70_006142 [Mortierella alpina]|uniref:LSM domain-containing protein n=1 Tax=Mortierella alpina TaxID=64518 RepID=A0A9P6INX7_MORAP|nr:hypothetical protein BGZ70_006142 [Mortierella alpina]